MEYVIRIKEHENGGMQFTVRTKPPAGRGRELISGYDRNLQQILRSASSQILAVRGKTEHVKVLHGLCDVCGHYGEDCTGKPAEPAAERSERYKCQDCGSVWSLEQLKAEIPHYHERVSPDEPEPAGECPECGALCHETERS